MKETGKEMIPFKTPSNWRSHLEGSLAGDNHTPSTSNTYKSVSCSTNIFISNSRGDNPDLIVPAIKFFLISLLNPFCWLNFKPVPSGLILSGRRKQLLPVAPLTGLQEQSQLSGFSSPSQSPLMLATFAQGQLWLTELFSCMCPQPTQRACSAGRGVWWRPHQRRV